uniref:LisH domain-containing protein ARMC9 n=1 Tax=Steinernema glaseri TaxID=37863 RepID=A0A1I7Y0G2_9BILA
MLKADARPAYRPEQSSSRYEFSGHRNRFPRFTCRLHSYLIFTLELDAEKGKKPTPSADDEDEEGDYAEAEIDSTDSMKPTLTELFGEQLLLKKFRQSGAPPVLVDDKLDTLPPGTVPRRPPGSRRQHTSTLTSKKNRQLPSSNVVPSSQKAAEASESRASSMMSHATFILENDKRKPLLADNGLKSVSQQSLKLSGSGNERKRTKVNTKEIHDPSNDDSSDRPSVSEPLPPAPLPPPPKPSPLPATRIRPPRRSDSEGRQLKDRGMTPASNCKAASTSILHTLPAESAPVSTNLPRRIPDDANADEYIAAFGSRPKVMRTPDNAGQPTSLQKKSVMMMY